MCYQKLGLQHFILYAHGPDLCHDVNIKHALANCFEAVMGNCLSSSFPLFAAPDMYLIQLSFTAT